MLSETSPTTISSSVTFVCEAIRPGIIVDARHQQAENEELARKILVNPENCDRSDVDWAISKLG